MRDPERITPIIRELQFLWRKHPDWRLGQLVCNLGRELGFSDPFYMEDDDLLSLLEAHIKSYMTNASED